MASHKFKVGDVVRLMSGGVNMTVDQVEGDEIYVTWMDGTQIRRDMLKAPMLTTPPPRGDN